MMTPEHLLLGYGASVRFSLFFNDYLYNNAHNFFLHVLVSGGLIGVVLYCILILLAANKMVSSRVSSTIVWLLLVVFSSSALWSRLLR